jgi:hypothetical protein
LNPQTDSFSIKDFLRQSILMDQTNRTISNPGDDFTCDDHENQGTEIDPRWNALLKLEKSDSSESKK